MSIAPSLVSTGDDGSGSMNPKFGHLHVVFRDWNYSGTAEEVSLLIVDIFRSLLPAS